MNIKKINLGQGSNMCLQECPNKCHHQECLINLIKVLLKNKIFPEKMVVLKVLFPVRPEFSISGVAVKIIIVEPQDLTLRLQQLQLVPKL